MWDDLEVLLPSRLLDVVKTRLACTDTHGFSTKVSCKRSGVFMQRKDGKHCLVVLSLGHSGLE